MLDFSKVKEWDDDFSSINSVVPSLSIIVCKSKYDFGVNFNETNISIFSFKIPWNRYQVSDL